MESEVFVKIINDTLKSFGFRKQGVRRWIRTGNDISLKVYLQKSQYGAFYYLRDYYVLNKMQVKSSNDKECPGDIVYSDEELLNKMCDLENDVPDQVRETSIRALLKDAFENHQYIETEEELREMILKRLLPEFKVVLEYLKIDQERYDQMWQAKRNARRMQSMAQIFEASPSGVYELCNKEKGFCLTYHPDGQEILIRINVFINPYTQNVDEVYQQKLDKLKYFTKVVPYENPMQEVEKIDADKANKLGFMHVELTIFDYVVDDDGSSAAFQVIWDKTEKEHEPEPW